MKFIAPTAAAVLALATTVQAQQPTSVAPKAMQTIAPALADYTDQVLFGDVWKRPGLPPRDRSLVTIAVLIATGKIAQLEGHLGRALDNGVQPSEIAGLVTHLAFYSGWPNAVSSLDVVERVFAKRDIDLAVLHAATAALPLPATEAGQARSVEEPVPVAPQLAQLTSDVLFGDLWRRQDLSPRDRSLVTIATLAANGDDDQLAFHIQRGLENGLTREMIVEALTHIAFYAGWPKATTAVAVAGKVFGAEPNTADNGAGERVRVIRPGTQSSLGPTNHFTGAVTITSPFQGADGARFGGATVTFQPGARTNWHTHPLGQLLIITAGHGWVQAEGETVRAVASGDVVWIPPGVKHWHGATRASAMTHVAVAQARNGSTVEWFEPVSDTEYRGPE